jgi:hypothetical protein
MSKELPEKESKCSKLAGHTAAIAEAHHMMA